MTNSSRKDYCFGTLALHKPYRDLGKQLAIDLQNYSPGTMFVVLTDKPADFTNFENVLAIKHTQESPLLPLNDKRRVIEKGLQKFSSVIFIDADSRIVSDFPDNINWPPGIVVNYDTQRSLAKNIEKYCSADQDLYNNLLKKLNLETDLGKARFPIPNLYIITKDNGKEEAFLEYWDKLALYTEVNRFKNVFDAYPMGLAIACVGWIPILANNNFPILEQSIKHLGNYKKTKKQQKTFFQGQKNRLLFYFRLIKVYFTAMSKNFKFYFK